MLHLASAHHWVWHAASQISAGPPLVALKAYVAEITRFAAIGKGGGTTAGKHPKPPFWVISRTPVRDLDHYLV